ncbi:ABC transporter permease [uncultured Corynebacterium sp.]|uniref:ABC transporter permease n=1 Tax=uncultured Corynebacterium sp. TaxID=159447 RepID=UPI0025D49721|nr:ABC transporter permease [uncultured Corynebacterium sp.]
MRATLAVTKRVLMQLRRDPRTLILVFAVPSLLMSLLYWILIDTQLFDRIAHAIFALFPFLVMFLVASITTLRERRSGTLERTLTMPVSRAAFIGGYALAFSLLSLVQTFITVAVCVMWLGVDVDGSLAAFFGIALLDALVGTAAGLTASAFARTEFQVVQFVPAVVVPQFLLCGLLVPRADMPRILEVISAAMPVSYAVDAMRSLGGTPEQAAFPQGNIGIDAMILLAFCVVLLGIASLSLRRRTP